MHLFSEQYEPGHYQESRNPAYQEKKGFPSGKLGKLSGTAKPNSNDVPVVSFCSQFEKCLYPLSLLLFIAFVVISVVCL
jgi:hypothetical protein